MCKRRIKYSELLSMYEDVVKVNDDLRLTNKALKNYSKNIKAKYLVVSDMFARIRGTSCPYCKDKSNWKIMQNDQWIAVNYCPHCGRLIEQSKILNAVKENSDED